jgi:thiamine kinase-like enzyme
VEQVLGGVQVLRPQLLRGRAGGIMTVLIPREELRSTAIALARLHTSAVRPNEKPPRTAAQEATRARERALRVAARYPAQAQAVLRVARQLATYLEALHPDGYRPAHGGVKPSQLLFQGQHVVLVDFDGFCLADAALDVGYFLAHLRPSRLWCHRPGLRPWFEAAAAVFVDAYRAAMLERGIAHAAIDGILERSRLYEAALLLKIAADRLDRLNSPRPQELSAILDELAACLAGEVRRQ